MANPSRHYGMRLVSPLLFVALALGPGNVLSLACPSHGVPNSVVVDRRSVLSSGSAVAAAAGGLSSAVVGWVPTPAHGSEAFSDTVDESKLVVPPVKAVLVLGANGQTGRHVVQIVASQGSDGGKPRRPCVATTRSGALDYDVNESVRLASVDVTSLESVRAAIAATSNLGAVVFCASVSSNQDSFAVDRDGVINAAKCCVEQRVPRLVVVSSGAVSRPDSPVYLLLNTVAKGIMEAKIQGEDAVRDMYRDPRLVEAGVGYTVIRPGGLTSDEPVGPSGLELNKGDTKSGRLSRQDVAALCVACLDSSAAFDTTFECYDKDTARPLQSVGLSNILRLRDPTPFKSGRECQGSTFPELFQSLERDFV
jgi:nucleoside-diphosphate-sugar epimerase